MELGGDISHNLGILSSSLSLTVLSLNGYKLGNNVRENVFPFYLSYYGGSKNLSNLTLTNDNLPEFE